MDIFITKTLPLGRGHMSCKFWEPDVVILHGYELNDSSPDAARIERAGKRNDVHPG